MNEDKKSAEGGSSPPPKKEIPDPLEVPETVSPKTELKRNFLISSIPSVSALSAQKNTLSRANSDRGVYNGQGIDAHPYPRGSVIEVMYGAAPKKTNNDGSIDDDDDEEDFEEDERDTEAEDNTNTQKSEVRLADIIDRAPSKTPTHEVSCYRWKYYIHYRGYNRRMDEWVTDLTRIISPPSVGNAKVRAIKKEKQEEERKSREREKRELEQASVLCDILGKRRKGINEANDGQNSPMGRPVSQRASSRRASAKITSQSNTNALNTEGNQTVHKESIIDEQERLRLTRSHRRKRGGGNDASEDDTQTTDNTISSIGTTILPETDMIKDKVVTVAAQELDEHEGLDEASLREHEEVTKVKNIDKFELGRYRMDTWYFSPLPKELTKDGHMIDVLFVCEFTLQFFTRKQELVRHQHKHLPTNRRHPPGNEIYRNGNLSMFEVYGFEERLYCQNLCYIAKLFLDHKTLYFDVDPFLFYVLCEVDERGFHPVGYYSKEKYSDVGYNLACILTFPCHQRKGYGRFLIDFSYELSKKEEKVGSPEKPMSDLGQQAYKPYWTSTIVDFLLHQSEDKYMSIMDISKRTSIMAEDIIFTLNMLGLLKYINGVYFITAERSVLLELAMKHPVKKPKVDPSKLHWTPYLTDVKRDKFSIHSKKPSIHQADTPREKGGF